MELPPKLVSSRLCELVSIDKLKEPVATRNFKILRLSCVEAPEVDAFLTILQNGQSIQNGKY